MRRWLGGAAAVAALTVRESLRQRLWLAFAATALLFVAVLPNLQAVDGSARLKLAVVAIGGGMGFVVTLLAVLTGSTSLRRDLEQRTGYLLFSKPLPVLAYLCGRWAGVQVALTAGVLALALVATAALALQFQGLPQMRRVVAPVSWQQVSATGEVLEVDAARQRIQLAGIPGNGVRWRLAGLPAAPSGDGLELLLRVEVRGLFPEQPVEEAQVRLSAIAADGTGSALTLDDASPYGRLPAGTLPVPGGVLVRDRDQSRADLGQDYLRLRLPAALIAADGSALIQLVRVDPRSVVVVGRESSLFAATGAGGFLANLLRGGLVLIASAGLLGAFALLCATLSNLGVTLLGGLTLFFAGNALPALRETLEYELETQALRRLVELALLVIPDFERFGVSAQLAAGQAVAWDTVASAWGYYGSYAALFLGLSWVALRRREL